MTIDYFNDGEIRFICDNCGTGLDTCETDFDEARKVHRQEGWIAVPRNEAWKNFCTTDCVTEYDETKRKEKDRETISSNRDSVFPAYTKRYTRHDTGGGTDKDPRRKWPRKKSD